MNASLARWGVSRTYQRLACVELADDCGRPATRGRAGTGSASPRAGEQAPVFAGRGQERNDAAERSMSIGTEERWWTRACAKTPRQR